MPYQTWGWVRRNQGLLTKGTHLLHELAVDCDISIRTVESLLQEGEENGDNDGSLQGLSKHDEEDGNGENVDGHDDRIAPRANDTVRFFNEVVMVMSLKGWGRWAGSFNAEGSI